MFINNWRNLQMSGRQRLTRLKKADPYSLGRDKENPPVSKYETGDPDTWAETPYDKHLWEGEKREETGHPAPADHDFGPSDKGDVHPGAKAASAVKVAKELRAKAIKCVRIAEHLFPKADETTLEQQGFDLMELSERAVNATLERISELEVPAAKEDDEDEKDEKKEELKKEAAEHLKKAKELLKLADEDEDEDEEKKSEAKEDDDKKEDDKEEEKKSDANPFAKEEEEEDCKEEAKETAETPQGKLAELLLKKASSLVEASEYEGALGNTAKAKEMKAAAEKTLAQAKKVHAGDMSDLPPEMQDKAKGMADKAPPAAPPMPPMAKEEEEVSNAGVMKNHVGDANPTASAKKAEAARHYEAARKLMAEAAALAGEDGAKDSMSESSNKPGDKPFEHPAAGCEEDEEAKSAKEDEEEDEEEAKETAEPVAKEEEEEKSGYPMEVEDGYEIDMVPKQAAGDEALESLFMDPGMKEAQEAYEKAFNGAGDGALEEEEGKETCFQNSFEKRCQVLRYRRQDFEGKRCG
jgi:hypothetical protein